MSGSCLARPYLILALSSFPFSSCIVATVNRIWGSGLQKQLDRCRQPLESCQPVICRSPLYPPLPAHLCSCSTHFNLFFLSATIYPASLPQPTVLLYLSPRSTLLHLCTCQLLRLPSLHLSLLFSSIIYPAKIAVLCFQHYRVNIETEIP